MGDWHLQRKIFSRWCSQKLRIRELEINDIVDDLKDGVLLVELLEVLSGKKFHKKKPTHSTSRVRQLDALNGALEFARKLGINPKAPIQAENFADGNDRNVLGYIWAIILKFLKLDEDDEDSVDVREALMLWLQNKTKGKATIKSFTKDIQDGKVLCAIIHKHRPKLVDWGKVQSSDGPTNLSLALDVGEKYMNVEKYLTVADIGKLSEISMVVYLMDWYYGVSLLAKQDAAARRIGRLIDFTRINDAMKANYIASSEKLVSWIQGKMVVLQKHEFDNTLEGIKALIHAFYEYKSNEKNAKLNAQLEAEGIFNSLAVRLSSNNRPPFQPEYPPVGLNAKFMELAATEDKRQEAMRIELQRQLRLKRLAERFAANLTKLNGWVSEKKSYLETKEEIDSIAKAELHLKILSAYNKEAETITGSRLKAVQDLAQDIIGDNYIHSKQIASDLKGMEDKFKELGQMSGSKQKVLEADLAREKEKERLRILWADTATEFERWVKVQIEEVAVQEFGDSLADVEAYGSKLEKSETEIQSTLGTKKQEYEQVWKDLTAMNVTDNDYTVLTLDSVNTLYGKLEQSVQSRRAAYDEELARQRANDALCRKFAGKVKEFEDWLNKEKTSSCQDDADLETQLAEVNQKISRYGEGDALFGAINDLSLKIDEAEITHNIHTSVTAEDVKASLHSYKTVQAKRKTLLETQIEENKKSGLSDEQLAEIDSVFASYDRDGDQQLTRRELKGCLLGLGEEYPPEKLNQVMKQYDADGDGKLNADEFREFMIKVWGDTNTEEEIVEGFRLLSGFKDVTNLDYLTAVVSPPSFTDDHVEYLGTEMSAVDGGLDYRTWTSEVFAR